MCCWRGRWHLHQGCRIAVPQSCRTSSQVPGAGDTMGTPLPTTPCSCIPHPSGRLTWLGELQAGDAEQDEAGGSQDGDEEDGAGDGEQQQDAQSQPAAPAAGARGGRERAGSGVPRPRGRWAWGKKQLGDGRADAQLQHLQDADVEGWLCHPVWAGWGSARCREGTYGPRSSKQRHRRMEKRRGVTGSMLGWAAA